MSEEKKDEKKKEGSFDPRCVAAIYDKLSSHNYALRAFAALLRSSDLFDFADERLAATLKSDNHEASNLRWGLSQIIDLYLAHQERIVEEYVDQYHESDICLMKWAKVAIDAVDQGAFITKDAAINKLQEAIKNLNIIINRNGELKEEAEKLKTYCMTYIKRMTGKKESG